MNKFFAFFMVVATSLACSCNSEVKFDKEKWNEFQDPVFPPAYRKKMVKDLMLNHKLIGLTSSQLVNYIGQPDYRSDSSMSYKIVTKYGGDIDPVYTEILGFSVSVDSVVTAFRIEAWKKQ